MLRELNENEMEMVAGGTEGDGDPIDEVITTGTRVTDGWTSVYPDEWQSVGMSATEYIFGIQSGLIELDTSILGAPVDLDIGVSVTQDTGSPPTVAATGTVTVTVVDSGSTTVTGTATGSVDTGGNTSGYVGVNITSTF